jgi:hypothetical protein
LKPIVLGQVATFVIAQVGMIVLSALLIQAQKRRLKLGHRK